MPASRALNDQETEHGPRANRRPQKGTFPPADVQPEEVAADNRGHRPKIGPNGEVTGSGAGAGGGGNPEDYDKDGSGGSGQPNPAIER